MMMPLRLVRLVNAPGVRREARRLVRRLLVVGVLGAGAFWLSRWEGPAAEGRPQAGLPPSGAAVGDLAVP